MPVKSARTKKGKRKKSTSWKKSKKNKLVKYKKAAKKAAAVSGALILCGVFLGGYILYKKITQPLVSASYIGTQDLSKKDIQTLLVVETPNLGDKSSSISNLYLNVYDYKDNSVTHLEIDTQQVIDMPGKVGEEPLYKALAVSNTLYSDVEPTQFLVDIVELRLGYVVDRFILIEKSKRDVYHNVLFSGGYDSLLPFSLSLVYSEFKSSSFTNLRSQEFYSIYDFTLQNPQKVEKKIKFDNTGSSLSLKDISLNSNFAEEKKSISILNGTKTPGLADYGSNVVENAGGRVISVSNSINQYQESILIVDDISSLSAEYLKSFFRVKSVITKEEAIKSGFRDSEISRSDITLILGFDFENLL